MEYVVFDLEWNMAGPRCRVEKSIREKLPYEITEIGAIRMNSRLEFVDEFSALVQPKIYQKLNPWVAGLTRQRWTDLLRDGEPFESAARRFMRWCGGPFIFCSWSDNDLRPLKENLAFYELPSRLPEHCLDVQHLFHVLVDQKVPQRSVSHAVEQLGIVAPPERTFHNATDDAWFTGAILRALMKQKTRLHDSVDTYSFVQRYAYDPNLNRKAVIRLDPTSLREGEEVYRTVDRLELNCPACERPLFRKTAWKAKKKSFTAHYCCEKHGEVTAKLGVWTNTEGKTHANLTLRLPKYANK